MPILTFPTLTYRPNEFEMGLVSNTMYFTSPLSKSVQTVEMPGARWRFSFTMDVMEEADTALFQAFTVQLRGQAGRFYMHNLARPAPRGTALGTPLVKGASQTGTSLVTDGWTINQAAALKVGDFFGVNGELKMVVSANVASDGVGDATIVFEPPLRSSPADNAPLTLTAPTAVFKQTSDDNGWTSRGAGLSTMSIQGEEVI